MKQATFKPKTGGLGLHNWLKRKTAFKADGRREADAKALRRLIDASKLMRYPVLGYLYELLMQVRPDRRKFTRGVVLNLNRELAERAENVVMPVDLMKKAVSEATCIAIMHDCICREAYQCQNYPRDLGCIFIGKGARAVVRTGRGREATVAEALAHIERGVAAGLIGQSLWVEVEQYVWGIQDEDMHRFLEICFCCPCCCSALKLARNASPRMRRRFRSAGWKARISPAAGQACGACRICSRACPVEAISNPDGLARVNRALCLGCGICAAQCPQSFIRLELAEPPRESIQDYFAELHLEL